MKMKSQIGKNLKEKNEREWIWPQVKSLRVRDDIGEMKGNEFSGDIKRQNGRSDSFANNYKV